MAAGVPTLDLAQLLGTYLPMDRRHALAAGYSLPEHTHGSALFADLSGFTPLAETLAQVHGPRRGAEELLRLLNAVFEAVIAEVHRCHGSVIGFAGDAITCWFGEPAACSRSVACAFAMQRAMRTFADMPAPLGLKVAIASGPARRFLAGDSGVQRLDVLAGATVTCMAAGEHVAARGEVVVDRATAEAIGDALAIGEWRTVESGEVFGLAARLQGDVQPCPWPPLAPGALRPDELRPYVPPAVYARLAAGQGEFLAELRPAVPLFIHFAGIDYDADPAAGEKLDAFVRHVQSVLVQHDGTLIQLTLGDKGSYLYAAFGVPAAHEDDARRAVTAALILRTLPPELACITALKIGISQGSMRTGASGSHDCHTYACIGDEVNLAARLMALAAPGEILVAGRVYKALAGDFAGELRPPVYVKGKARPVTVFSVSGALARRAIRLQEPAYVLPMVGRAGELQVIEEKLELARQGQGQVLGITGEAGVGKSRLVSEVIRLARLRGFTGYGGACQAAGTHHPYLVWKPIWQAFFNVDPAAPPRKQLRAIAGDLADLAPERVEALPLLGAVLDLNIPDNDFTRLLEAEFRKSALEALLLACLAAAAREEPLLLVLEDLHWIDPVSHDLLERAAQAAAALPVMIVMAYRPPHITRLQPPRVEALPHCTVLRLGELGMAEAEQLVHAKLALLFPEQHGAAPPALVAQITAHAQGNPFYLEELLNYLHDRGLDPHQAGALDLLDLPDSLHRLILARIDRLAAQQQRTLKVASVIGRQFRVAHLHGYCPTLGEPPAVEADLEALTAVDLTALDGSEAQLTYLFRHIVTHEVAYETLLHATRTALHEQYARFLEGLAGDETGPYLDALAYHYERSENAAKKREYLRRAGQAAAARSANAEALEYLSRALALAPEDAHEERYTLLLARERVCGLQGNRGLQLQDLEALAGLAGATGRPADRCEVILRRADYAEVTGDYAAAITAAQDAIALSRAAGRRGQEAAAQLVWGRILWRQGDAPGARSHLEQALVLARDTRRDVEADSLRELGALAYAQGDLAEARRHYQHSLIMAREAGDRSGEAASLRNLGIAAWTAGEAAAAREYHEQSLAIRREIGDRRGEAVGLANVGGVAYRLGDHAGAGVYFAQSLAIRREIADRRGQAHALMGLGSVTSAMGDYAAARDQFAESAAICREISDRQGEWYALMGLGRIVSALGDHARAREHLERSLAMNRESGDRHGEADILTGLGVVCLAQGDAIGAEAHHQQSLAVYREIGEPEGEGYALTNLGDALAEQGRWEEAATAFLRAVELRRGLSREALLMESLGGLARARLAQGEVGPAHQHVAEILQYVDAGKSLNDADQPALVYLTCNRVLRAVDDPRAQEMLVAAHDLVRERAARIPDEEAREAFVAGCSHHREIMREYARAGEHG